MVRMENGSVKQGDRILLSDVFDQSYQVIEVGVMALERAKIDQLEEG